MKKKMFVGLVVIFLSLTGFTLESSSELVTVSASFPHFNKISILSKLSKNKERKEIF